LEVAHDLLGFIFGGGCHQRFGTTANHPTSRHSHLGPSQPTAAIRSFTFEVK
jgi:hypothetical protein